MNRSTISRVMVATAVVMTVVAVGGQPAGAAKPPKSTSTAITVTSPLDVVADNGFCSLREAVTAANTNTASGASSGECGAGSATSTDVIVLPVGGYGLSIENPVSGPEDLNASGDLDVLGNLVIRGGGSTSTIIDAIGLEDRILHLGPGTSLELSGVKLRDAASDALGGGIFTSGTLSLTDVWLSNNHGHGGGGLVAHGGTVTVANSLFSDNSATNEAGGLLARNGASVTLTNTAFSGNESLSSFGGAIAVVDSSTVSVVNSSLSANRADASGGAIAVGSSSVTITSSTMSGNAAPFGGAIINVFGTMTVTNSTVSGNTGAFMGGIMNDEGGILRAINSTVAGNRSTDTSSPRAAGIWSEDLGATATVVNTILAGNSPSNCAGVGDGGFNISFNGSGCPTTFGTGDPKLGLLGNNGGPTQTHALGPGSAAIDAGHDSECTGALPTGAGGTDQRGASRNADGNGDGTAGCDIGAFELNDADLQVSVSADDSVEGGSEMTFVITVTNAGPLTESAALLRNTLPNGTKFLSYTVTQGSCTTPSKKQTGGVVQCPLGEILTGTTEQATITIKVLVSATSPLTNVARVEGTRFDPNTSNNVAQTNVTVT